MRRGVVSGVLALLIAGPAVASETIHLLPEGPDHWGARNIFAPLTSIFLGPGYWYGERKIQIQTTPPEAIVDLFYVRAGFQKRFEQAEAPVTVVLPKRIDANPKDVVIVRAFVEGYRVQEATVKLSSRTDEVHFDMLPLPNRLLAVGYRYFGGRASLSFLTEEAPTVRVQERENGFSAALTETGKGEEVDDSVAGIRGPMLASVQAHQLGEDLLVEVEYGAGFEKKGVDLRSRAGHDPIRDVHIYSLDIVGSDSGAAAVTRVKSALDRITRADVKGCAAVFDDELRAALDPAALARALTPRGEFTDRYLRAAMRRLGQVSGDGVTLVDGTRYHTEVPFQLAAAMNEAANVRGYLALLRRMVTLSEPASDRRAVLRSLVAPELPTSAFGDALDAAEAAERRCRR